MVAPVHLFANTVIKQGYDFILEEIFSGERFWGIASLPNNNLLLTEFKTGNLLLVEFTNDTLKTTTIALSLPIENRGQAGLLDIALHPNFAQNNYIYLSYSKRLKNGSSLALIRGEWHNHTLINITQLYETPSEVRTQHYSGAIAFDSQNRLYLASGDRNNRHQAQDLTNSIGKILRFNDDGTIPLDNPLIKQNNVAKEIYAWGIRNAQGLAYDARTNTLWQSEQGPQGGDELNIIRAGQNYGWPEVTTGQEYGGGRIGVRTKAGMVDPIKEWTPSPAFSSLLLYTHNAIPSLTNKLLIPSLKAETLFVISVDKNKVTAVHTIIKGEIGRIRDVKSAPNGIIYLVNDAGKLYRLRPR
ncbi:PQQ-dependent sugar dehydrogenase [Entomospira culicis]|nr:PQQ-dependent sugar dehydrogenase [Entomospira culicis]WDI36565.1 PQQ-dependent sugar dehydrogenase [Entomospira culicis]